MFSGVAGVAANVGDEEGAGARNCPAARSCGEFRRGYLQRFAHLGDQLTTR